MPRDPSPAASPLVGPRLLPGALVLRRDARTLQVGTAPGVVVRDRPGLRRVLRLLDGSLPLGHLSRLVARDVPEFTDDLTGTVGRLVAAGAVTLPGAPAEPRVAVRHDGSSAGLAALIAPAFGAAALEPDVEVVLSAGEPGRSAFEVLATAGVPHLPVVLLERSVRLGPFVVPGVTPCLGCLDALLTAYDPAWSVLVPQFERPRTVTVALPHGLLLRAAAEAVAQVETLLAGGRPATTGHALWLGPGQDDADLRPVPFASECPCGLLAR